MLGQKVLSQPRTVFGPAQPRNLPEELRCDGAGDIVRLRALLVRKRQNPPTPRLERMGVGLGVRTQVITSPVERGTGDVGPPPPGRSGHE